jgi:hypothetical protein
MDAHEEACKVESLLNKLFEDHPLSPESAESWLEFTKKLKEGINGMENRVKNSLDLQTEIVAKKNAI